MQNWEKEQAVEEMRSDLFYADEYRNRARALDNLGSLLRCETPGTVSKVRVKGIRWWRTSESEKNSGREIELTDTERREFRDWCEERAYKLRDRADELELGIALNGKVEES